MLQRKLLLRLGLLTVGFVVGAVVAITMLQRVLRDLDTMNAESASVTDAEQALGSAIALIEADTSSVRKGQVLDASELNAHHRRVRDALGVLSVHSIVRTSGPTNAAYARVNERIEGSLQSVPGDVSGLREAFAELTRATRQEITTRQASLSRRLRTMIIGLTLAALAMVNISVFVLLRTARMILNPVSQLLEGSRELAREHFDHRITVDQQDEFAELARAHNRLADELASNEQRKVQALRQLAVTLSHELNNVINIINLRLEIMSRLSGIDSSLAAHLREIHDNLNRMASTIASLRNVRRIVLTDYLPGEKMIDLPRSVALDDEPGSISTPSAGAHAS